MIDANQQVETQQSVVRNLVAKRINLADYKRSHPVPSAPPLVRERKFKQEPLEE